jgi:hypothetical protein
MKQVQAIRVNRPPQKFLQQNIKTILVDFWFLTVPACEKSMHEQL